MVKEERSASAKRGRKVSGERGRLREVRKEGHSGDNRAAPMDAPGAWTAGGREAGLGRGLSLGSDEHRGHDSRSEPGRGAAFE